ncbi:MAG: SDR family oxidoreductase [Acetobacteraceae bacterium]|nr:SDR family oxidoreductase [Acetobacteraceae bacterium]
MRSIVVTGGTKGLGLGISRTLVTEGYRVIAIARREGESFAAAVREAPTGTLWFRPADLSDIAAIPGMVRELRQAFGPIYGLINNAGLGTSGALALMQDHGIERLVSLNVMSPIVLTKYVVRFMMAEGRGRIINIASVAGLSGYKGLAAYSATKAAMIGFTRSLAREVGSLGITVNAVAPGFVDTEMTESLRGEQRETIVRRSAMLRLAEPEDIANAVAFLLHEKSRNITGSVLTVDAGSTA